MTNICFVLAVAALAIGAHAGETDKLVGAENAEIGEFPYQVSLRVNGNKHFCAGALITKKHVLTAAHCVFATRKSFFPLTVYAVVGTNSLTSGGKTYKTKAKFQHPRFVGNKKIPDWMNDIGVFTLSEEVATSDLIGLVKLPTKDVTIGTEAVVSGWGSMINPLTPPSKVLQKLTVKIIDHEKCQSMMPSWAKVDETHICTFVKKGKGSCSGDSGGPLVQDGIIIGVVSGGIPCAKGHPDIYTNVYKHLSYVKDIIDA